MKFVQATAAIISTQYGINVEQTEEFVAGMIYGLIKEDDLPEIQKCMTNADTLETEITEAFEDFSKGDFKDILKAVQEVGEIVKEVPADLADCEGMSDDLAKLEAWAAIFTNPAKLVSTLTKNLLANWKQVSADISTTNSDWGNAKYYEAGQDVADVIILSVGAISEGEDVTGEIDYDLAMQNMSQTMFSLFWETQSKYY